MSTPSGPSQFVEVSNVLYGTLPINAVSNIKFNSDRQILKGKNNNYTRYVSSHTVFYTETVTFDTEDVYALEQLESTDGIANLTFTWVAAAQQLTSSPLPNQAVTIANCVIEGIDRDAMSKGFGKAMVKMTILGLAEDADPISYAAA